MSRKVILTFRLCHLEPAVDILRLRQRTLVKWHAGDADASHFHPDANT